MITLPVPSRRAHRATFWTLVSLVVALLAASVPWPGGWPLRVGCGSVVWLTALVAGLAWPVLIKTAYRGWNVAARWVSRACRWAISAICFFVVFTVVRVAGSRFSKESPRDSAWVPRGTLPADQYLAPFAGPLSGWGRQGWVRDYWRWANATGHLWAVCLLPFLMLLAALEEEEERTFPANIYTLF